MSCFICLPSFYFTVSALPEHAEIPSFRYTEILIPIPNTFYRNYLTDELATCLKNGRKRRVGEKVKGQRNISLLSHVHGVVMKELSSEDRDEADSHALCSISLLRPAHLEPNSFPTSLLEPPLSPSMAGQGTSLHTNLFYALKNPHILRSTFSYFTVFMDTDLC